MDRKTREKTLRLLAEKKLDPTITYADIEIEAGYSGRQLMRLLKRPEEELSPWSDEFHAPYLNTKFSYRPTRGTTSCPCPAPSTQPRCSGRGSRGSRGAVRSRTAGPST